MTWLILVLMVLLVIFSAFFSSSEIAYASANRLRLHKAAEDGSRTARSAVFISDNFPRFLSTVLVGNDLVNIAFSSCMTVLLADIYGASGETAAPIAATAVLLLFGEIIPKIAGKSRAEKAVYLYARPLRFFMLVFSPIVFLVSKTVEKLSPIWTPKDPEPEVTDDELVTILETIEEEGVFTEQESELIKSAIEFSDVTAADIYIPRVDICSADVDDDVSEILANTELLSYSRIPVYRETIDNIIGILPTKKLMKAAISQPPESISIERLLMPPLFVHMTRHISSILTELRKKHMQMAIVADEFGGTLGILTLEDILEEIVGDIFDESDEVEPDVTEEEENVYNVDGTTTIDDFFEYIDYRPENFTSEYTTMGGWAIEMLDRFPEPGDSFTWDRFEVTVTAADAMRVEELKIKLLPPPEDDG